MFTQPFLRKAVILPPAKLQSAASLHMNIAIIGAGITGLATAVALHQQGIQAHVYERTDAFREIGLGFIVLPNGVEVLRKYRALPAVPQDGLWLSEALLQTPEGEVFKREKLTDCLGIKRSRIIDALISKIPDGFLHTGYDLCGYEMEDDRYTHACFANGEKVQAGLFIAADGANSLSRRLIYPHHHLRQTPIEELVGIANAPEVASFLGNNLLKTQLWEKHLSFGILPCNEQQVIWYMQYHSHHNPLPGLEAATKQQFVHDLVGHWPAIVQETLAQTNFDEVFCWKTRDMDVLPTYHHQNLVLAGDAAHLALPFTSQGTSSGLADADWLATHLSQAGAHTDWPALFHEYHHHRRPDIEKYLEFGRHLEQRFLYPQDFAGVEMPMPLAK